MKITNDDGKEIEVFTAEEVQAKVKETETTVTTKLQGDFTKTKTELEEKLTETQKALGERASEFGKFRKLNDEVVAKLGVAERTIYENQKAMAEAEEKRIEADKKAQDARVDATIRAKAGSDEKLFTKMKDMWGLIGINAATPEEMEKKSLMILGALRTTEPDLVASVAGFSNSGSYTPPKPAGSEGKSFADSDKGRAGAAELGLIIEAPKK